MSYHLRLFLTLYTGFLLCWSGAVFAGLPGPCEGTVSTNLGICIPRSSQTPWHAEYTDMVNKVDAHAGSTTAHGATSANTPSTTVARDSAGNINATTFTGALTGNAATATALSANGTNCSGNTFALGVDASGGAECAQPAFSNLSGSATDAQIPDNITITGYLPLTGGTLTGQLVTDNLGIEWAESDTNPTCAAGVYSVYADLSEAKLKKCQNGVSSDIGTASGASGDITDVWGCGTGDCSTITAAAGDSLDAGAATSSRPATRSTALPATCSEGQFHQDTDSGGAETYVCTDVNVWTKFIAPTDNVATATALAANPADCSGTLFANAIAANGTLSCVSVAGVGKAVADTAGNGVVIRTGDGTATARTITGTTGNLTVTNGDGVSGNPTLDVAATVVQTDQANTWTTGAQDFGSATSLTIPTANGAAPTAAGLLAYDSTSHTVEAGVNGVNKTLALTDGNIATATALAANGSDCSAGNFPLGTDASGSAEGCTDAATQAELDAHDALTATHGAVSTNTASRIVLRDASGNFSAGTISAALSGNATTATALAANGGNCSGDTFALGVDASGGGECAQPAFANLSGSATDAQVPDTITVSNYLALTGGTLTGQLVTDNLGIEFDESDTNPTCAAGNFSTYADLSENKLKKCENGVVSDLGAVSGSSGDITDVWNCSTGDCQTLTAAAGDSLDGGSATAMSPTTRSTTLPATCSEGQLHQDTDSGGTETYVCTATDTWTKTLAATDAVATATALAANGGNCAAGNFPLGVDTLGAVETCTDAATQTELDTHEALTSTHGAVSTNTASRIVLRDGSGNFSAQTITASLTGNASTATALAANGTDCSAGTFPLGVDTLGAAETCTDVVTQAELVAGTLWVSIPYEVESLPTCDASSIHTHATVINAVSCSEGEGASRFDCVCDGTEWVSMAQAAIPSLSTVYGASGSTPTVTAGANGLTWQDFNSIAKAEKHCNTASGQCVYEGIDDSGAYFKTFEDPTDLVTKLYTGKVWGLTTFVGNPIITSTEAGAITVATSLAGTGAGTVTANRTSCTGTDILKADGTCMSDVVRVLHKESTDVALANDATERVIGLYTIPANTLGTNSCVVGKFSGVLLNNTGSTQSPAGTVRVRIGGTAGTLGGAPGSGGTTSPALTVTANTAATSKTSTIRAHVCGDGATNAQRVWTNWEVNVIQPVSSQSNPTGASTGTLVFEVTMQLGIADAALTYTQDYGNFILEP